MLSLHICYPPGANAPQEALGGPQELSGGNFLPIANSPTESYRGTEKIPRELLGDFTSPGELSRFKVGPQ